MSGKLIYKKEVVSGSPYTIDSVRPDDNNPVTSNAVNNALTEYSKYPDYSKTQQITMQSNVVKQFQPDKNGVLSFCLLSWNNLHAYVKINNVLILEQINANNSYDVSISGQFIVSKGDVIELNGGVYQSRTQCTFTPFKE